jgi:hypothetical protein
VCAAGADVAAALAPIGAASVAVVAVPPDWPDRWDVADPPPDGVAAEALARMLADARAVEPSAGTAGGARGEGKPAMPPGFFMAEAGVFRRAADPEKPDVHVCGPLTVVAATHDGTGHAWGVVAVLAGWGWPHA